MRWGEVKTCVICLLCVCISSDTCVRVKIAYLIHFHELQSAYLVYVIWGFMRELLTGSSMGTGLGGGAVAAVGGALTNMGVALMYSVF